MIQTISVLRVLSLLFVLLGILPARAFNAAYWSKTSISEAALLNSGTVDNKNCYAGFLHFRGCMTVLNRLADQAGVSQMVVPSRLAKNPKFLGGKVIGHLSSQLWLVEKPDPGLLLSLRSLAQTFESQEDLKTRAWMEEFKATRKNKPIDFVKYTHFLLSEAFAGAPATPAKLGDAVSAFFGASGDPHSAVIPFQRLLDLQRPTTSFDVGIGMDPQNYAGQTIVFGLTPGGPAETAGLRRNDFLKSIDGRLVREILRSGEDLEDLFKGKAGTSLRISVMRSGLPIEFVVVRQVLEIQALQMSIETHLGHEFISVRINTFMDERLCGLLVQELKLQESPNTVGIILDLRDNSGGRMDIAECVLGSFVGEEQTGFYVVLKDGSFEGSWGRGPQVTRLPLVTLVNPATASAAEFAAGALHELERSWIVGQRTFGKGTAQKTHEFGYDYTMIALRTKSGIYLPSGYSHQLTGIIPDFATPPQFGVEEPFALREADLFPGSIVMQSGPWVQTRTKDIARINLCRKSALAEKSVVADPKLDYQKLVAAEVLLCDRESYKASSQ